MTWRLYSWTRNVQTISIGFRKNINAAPLNCYITCLHKQHTLLPEKKVFLVDNLPTLSSCSTAMGAGYRSSETHSNWPHYQCLWSWGESTTALPVQLWRRQNFKMLGLKDEQGKVNTTKPLSDACTWHTLVGVSTYTWHTICVKLDSQYDTGIDLISFPAMCRQC